VAAFTVNVPILLGQVPDLQGDLKAAATAEGSGHYEEAAALYEKLLSGIDSSKVDPWVGVHVRTRLATVYYLLHRYRESVEAVAPLTSKNAPAVQLPAQAWLVQGLDQLELGQLSQAMDSLRRTLAVNPDSGTARLALGDALERSGRPFGRRRVVQAGSRLQPPGGPNLPGIHPEVPDELGPPATRR